MTRLLSTGRQALVKFISVKSVQPINIKHYLCNTHLKCVLQRECTFHMCIKMCNQRFKYENNKENLVSKKKKRKMLFIQTVNLCHGSRWSYCHIMCCSS